MAILANAANQMVFFSSEGAAVDKVLLTPAADERIILKEFHIALDNTFASGTAANIQLSSGAVAGFKPMLITSICQDGTSASPFFWKEGIITSAAGETLNLSVFGAGGTPTVGGWIRYELY